jgi:hypothetical protein
MFLLSLHARAEPQRTKHPATRRLEELEARVALLEESLLRMASSSVVSPPSKPANEPEPACDYIALLRSTIELEAQARQLETSFALSIS